MEKRYIEDINLNMDPAYVEKSIQAYLKDNNFNLVSEKGEDYYKSSGSMTLPRGFKYWYVYGILHIEAWIGNIGYEMNIGDRKLKTAEGEIPYYNSVLLLMSTLEKGRQLQQQSYDQMQEPVYEQSNDKNIKTGSTVIQMFNKANERITVIAFWFYISSLIFMFGSRLYLLINVLSCLLVISYGLKSRKIGMATAAIIINLIILVITLIRIFMKT